LLRNWLAGSKTVVSISRDATVDCDCARLQARGKRRGWISGFSPILIFSKSICGLSFRRFFAPKSGQNPLKALPGAPALRINAEWLFSIFQLSRFCSFFPDFPKG